MPNFEIVDLVNISENPASIILVQRIEPESGRPKRIKVIEGAEGDFVTINTNF